MHGFRCYFLCLISAMIPLSSFAEDDVIYAENDSISISSSLMLQELVVSSSRWWQASDIIPTKVTSLDFEEINRYNPQTAADMLGLTGEVFVQKSQYGGGSPMIRGFETNRLL